MCREVLYYICGALKPEANLLDPEACSIKVGWQPRPPLRSLRSHEAPGENMLSVSSHKSSVDSFYMEEPCL